MEHCAKGFLVVLAGFYTDLGNLFSSEQVWFNKVRKIGSGEIYSPSTENPIKRAPHVLQNKCSKIEITQMWKRSNNVQAQDWSP